MTPPLFFENMNHTQNNFQNAPPLNPTEKINKLKQELMHHETERDNLRKKIMKKKNDIGNAEKEEKIFGLKNKLNKKEVEKNNLINNTPKNPEHLDPNSNNSHHIAAWHDHKGKLDKVHREIKDLNQQIQNGGKRKRRTKYKRRTKHKRRTKYKRRTKHKRRAKHKRRTKRRKHRRSRRK